MNTAGMSLYEKYFHLKCYLLNKRSIFVLYLSLCVIFSRLTFFGMLIRFYIKNVLSFSEETEFNLIPYNRIQQHKEHLYDVNGFKLLKAASIYGANGAGKSNIIKGISFLQDLVLDALVGKISSHTFKFLDELNQVLGIEFIKDGIPFIYEVEIQNDVIISEELFKSGLGKHDDELVYRRSTDQNNVTSIQFNDSIEKEEKIQVLKNVLLEEFVKPTKTVLKIFANRDNPSLVDLKIAFSWFQSSLVIIAPETRPFALADALDTNENLKLYSNRLLQSFNLGIENLGVTIKRLEDLILNAKTLEDVKKEVDNIDYNILPLTNKAGDEIVVVKKNDTYFVKEISLKHKNINNTATFQLSEESDGTKRLLQFIPAFMQMTHDRCTFIIDEIERSIHPLLIKELIRKFTDDENSLGQLIFSTHESNLLDLEIFRQDEIWFAEKDITGSTDLYSLSDFKEHNTLDIRKGYLTGRYGSIPFLGNLKDLNWHLNES